MKKFYIIWSSIFILMAFILTIDMLNKPATKIKKLSEMSGVNLHECKIIYSNDTHGGFHGDGEYFAKLDCSSLKDYSTILKWNKLPLNEDIKKEILVESCSTEKCTNVLERYNIPNIKNGYYYFIDRNSTYDNKLNIKIYYNYSLFLYDEDNKNIYYYELDT